MKTQLKPEVKESDVFDAGSSEYALASTDTVCLVGWNSGAPIPVMK